MTTTSAGPRLSRWVGLLIALHIVVICMLVVLLMRTVPADTPPTPAVRPSAPNATDQLLARITGAIEAGQWDTASDHLNAAIILSPERADVFNAVLHCVEAGLASDDPDAADLAWDLYVRADAMVPYQAPDAVGSARQRVAALQPLFEAGSAEPAVDALSVFRHDTRVLLTSIRDPQVPLETRMQLAGRLRASLDTLVDAVTLGEYTPKIAMPTFWKLVADARRDCDWTEQQLLGEAFTGVKGDAEHWLSREVPAALAKADTDDADERALERLAMAGQVHLVAIAPYRAAGVQGAAALTERVEAAVDRLSRAGGWVYNRKALRHIKAIDDKNALLTPMQKLEALATIHEHRLGDYAQSQFAKAWQAVFDELKAEDDKVKAAQLRIVRSLTP